jgi:hypothetical protein
MLNEIREKLKEKQQAANKPFVHIRDAEEILEYQEKIFYMALEEILNQSNHSIPVHAFGDNEAACAMNDALNNIQQIAWDILNENKESNRLDGVVIQKPADLLDECCKALGWQGGTIHQIINVLSAAKQIKLAHSEAELNSNWDRLKAAIATLKAVL